MIYTNPNLSSGIVSWGRSDAETLKFKMVNESAMNNLGYTMEELRKLTPVDLKPDYSKKSFLALLEPLTTRAGERIQFETVYQRKDRSFYDVDISIQLLSYEGEAVFVAIILDCTEKKKAQATIIKQIDRLQKLSGLALTLTGDSSEIFELILRMVSEMFTADYVHIAEPQDDKLRIICAYQNEEMKADYDIPFQATPCEMVVKGEKTCIYHDVLKVFPKTTILKDIKAFTYWGIPIFDKNGCVVATLALIFDKHRENNDDDMKVLSIIGQRIAIEIERDRNELQRNTTNEKLRQSESKLRALAAEIAIAEERERRRIAIELHDNIIQDLGLCKIKLGELGRKLSKKDHDYVLDELREIISKSIKESRTLVFELSSPILYELGLEAAIKWLAEEKAEKLGFICQVEVDEQVMPITIERQEFLYKAVRELLINVGKHAQATEVNIYISRVDDEISIGVEDNGIGFDPENIELDDGGNKHFGLFGIKERLNLLQGNVTISSSSDHGTSIILTAPLELDG